MQFLSPSVVSQFFNPPPPTSPPKRALSLINLIKMKTTYYSIQILCKIMQTCWEIFLDDYLHFFSNLFMRPSAVNTSFPQILMISLLHLGQPSPSAVVSPWKRGRISTVASPVVVTGSLCWKTSRRTNTKGLLQTGTFSKSTG